MKWAFVDYENVNSLDLVNLNDFEWVILFCGPKDKNLKIDLSSIEVGKSPRLEIIRLDKSAKNNLDFHLALCLGRYHETVEGGVEFSIVSNDTGFDGIISYLKKLGRKCKRVKEKKVAKKAVKKAVTRKSAKKVTKKAVVVANKEVALIVRPKLNSSELMKALIEALEAFRKHPVSGWPKTEVKLERWLEDKVKLPAEHSRELVASMVRKKCISLDGGEVTYFLKLNNTAE